MRRLTWILLILFFALGIFVWFKRLPENEIKTIWSLGTPTPTTFTENLISPENGPINKVSVQKVGGNKVTIDKTSGKWIVVTAIKRDADQNLAEEIAGQALDLRINRKFTTAPSSRDTGLNQPDYKITLLLINGSLFSLDIGKQTVIGSGYYVGTEEGSVYIIRQNEIDSLISILDDPPMVASKTETPPPGK